MGGGAPDEGEVEEEEEAATTRRARSGARWRSAPSARGRAARVARRVDASMSCRCAFGAAVDGCDVGAGGREAAGFWGVGRRTLKARRRRRLLPSPHTFLSLSLCSGLVPQTHVPRSVVCHSACVLSLRCERAASVPLVVVAPFVPWFFASSQNERPPGAPRPPHLSQGGAAAPQVPPRRATGPQGRSRRVLRAG